MGQPLYSISFSTDLMDLVGLVSETTLSLVWKWHDLPCFCPLCPVLFPHWEYFEEVLGVMESCVWKVLLIVFWSPSGFSLNPLLWHFQLYRSEVVNGMCTLAVPFVSTGICFKRSTSPVLFRPWLIISHANAESLTQIRFPVQEIWNQPQTVNGFLKRPKWKATKWCGLWYNWWSPLNL